MAKVKHKKNPTKTDVLDTLLKSREHIDTKWVRGTWFTYVDDDDVKMQEGSVPSGAPVTGVCAAGSVLYALDYTDEQWTEASDVKPVIEALYEALPPRSRAAQNAHGTVKDLNDPKVLADRPWLTPEQVAKEVYDAKLDAVISYNDANGRRKGDVLALFDRAIENVRASIPPTIQEMAL